MTQTSQIAASSIIVRSNGGIRKKIIVSDTNVITATNA